MTSRAPIPHGYAHPNAKSRLDAHVLIRLPGLGPFKGRCVRCAREGDRFVANELDCPNPYNLDDSATAHIGRRMLDHYFPPKEPA